MAIGCFLGAIKTIESVAKPDPDRLAKARADVGLALVEAGHASARNYFEDVL